MAQGSQFLFKTARTEPSRCLSSRFCHKTSNPEPKHPKCAQTYPWKDLLGVCGPGYEGLGPGCEDLGPGYEDLGPGYEDLGPGYEDLGPAYEDLGARY